MSKAAGTPITVSYTRESMRDVVQGVAHILGHFSDHEHPGLREPQNIDKVVPDTGVLVHPNVNGTETLVGFQFFLDGSVAGVMFDFLAYEKYGEDYVFRMLKKLSEKIREINRPSEARLKQLNKRYLLNI
ncbi:MAG: hypothetical protein KAG66_19305 [Methylococcales bacterium]|nr:hypothetical protein [Methylococcales bacterium]